MSTASAPPKRSDELEIRGYRPEDADALRAIALTAFEDGELNSATRCDVERWLSRLPASPSDTLVAVRDGQVAGLITPHRHMVVVQRDLRRRGIGRRLVEAVESVNRARGAEPLCLALPHDNEGAGAFFGALGLTHHHSTWRMRLRDDAPVPPPAFPAGVVRHRYRDEDVEVYVELFNAAFRDHPTPLSVSVERTRYVQSLPGFDPENLCLLAPVDAPDALIALCRVDLQEDEGGTLGDVAFIGVRPEWRRQGLGRELLRWGVHRLRDSAAGAVFLAVEGDNAGARRLYEANGFALVEEWPRYARVAG